ncbi:hypothetical protein [Aliterella atlantica]
MLAYTTCDFQADEKLGMLGSVTKTRTEASGKRVNRYVGAICLI